MTTLASKRIAVTRDSIRAQFTVSNGIIIRTANGEALDPDAEAKSFTSDVNVADETPKAELCSSFQDICRLLKIQTPAPLVSENTSFRHLRFRAGQKIHYAGDKIRNLYLVNCGFLKTSIIDDSCHELILSFPMKSDLIGTDSLYQEQHNSDLIALTDGDLILIPHEILLTISRKSEELERALFFMMSRELARERYQVSKLRSLSAEAKIARFLCDMSERFSLLGYSAKSFNLRMSRLDIASYLGVAMETVSRTLSAFHRLGVIKVQQRAVEIIDHAFLSQLLKLDTTDTCSSPTVRKARLTAMSIQSLTPRQTTGVETNRKTQPRSPARVLEPLNGQPA